MYPAITNVRTEAPYKLVLEFDSGEVRIFDVAPLLSHGRFRELARADAFAQVRVAFDTVEWSNGLDLDPEYLYQESQTWVPTGPAVST